MSDIESKLQADLPRDVILRHPQNGSDYVPAWWVITRLNQVFGHLGWSIDYGEPSAQMVGQRMVVRVAATLSVAHGDRCVSREDIGVALSAGDKPEAIETAFKAAYTDALKRCARTLGPSLGLALYEKGERTTVGLSQAAQQYADELEACATLEACDAWVARRGAELGRLDEDEKRRLRELFQTRRRAFAPDQRSLVERIIEEIEKTQSADDLADVRRRWADDVRAMGERDRANVKAAAEYATARWSAAT